jgi:arylsulfatase A-like enzyme
MRFGLLMVGVDAYRIARSDRALPLPALLQGLIAALFRTLLVSLGAAAVLAALVALVRLRRIQTGRASARARLRAFLRDAADPSDEPIRAGDLLSSLLLMAAAAAGVFAVSERLITGMARPEFAALAVVAAVSVTLACGFALRAPLAALMTVLAEQLLRVPGVGPRYLSRTRHFAIGLMLAIALGLGLAIWHYRTPLAYLPWRAIGQLLGCAAAAVILQLLARREPRWLRRTLQALALLIVLASGVCAQLQSPLAVLSRQIAERDSLGGQIGQRALLWLWDRDHDGYLPFLGGGDCAPLDFTRNPAANEIPGNGRDEDCDGSDLDLATSAPRGKFDYAVPAAVPHRPPIVLITVDAFAASHMHALGYARSLTPNIDALAARSVFFRDCFAQGPSTRLSFPSLFTSRWDTQIEQELVGRHPFPISPHETLLAQTLSAAGYDTVAVLPDFYFGPRFWSGITRGFARVVESPYTTEPHLPHNGGRVTAAAIEELARDRQKPLFLWVHYYDAHSPHEQPSEVPAYGKTRKDLYDAELNFVDIEVGHLLDAIEKRFDGQALVVLTGDHGVAFDEPRHATFNYGYDLYTNVLHVPLIVHAPFLAARHLDNIVSTMDIVPSLANLLRLRGPARYQGMSLVPELFSGKASRPAELMAQMFLEERLWKHEEPLERVALRTDQYDLLQDRKTGFFELYDFRKDYLEAHDLSIDPVYGPQLAQLRKQLTALLYNARPQP